MIRTQRKQWAKQNQLSEALQHAGAGGITGNAGRCQTSQGTSPRWDISSKNKPAMRKTSSTPSIIILKVMLTFNQVQLVWICKRNNLSLQKRWRKIKTLWSWWYTDTDPFPNAYTLQIALKAHWNGTYNILLVQITHKMTENKENHLKTQLHSRSRGRRAGLHPFLHRNVTGNR